MNSHSSPWQKLVSAARCVPENTEADAEAPFGFSTRVAAQAFLSHRPRPASALFARFSLPALGVAALFAALAVATNLKPVLSTFADDVATLSEPVTDTGDSSA